MKASVHRTATLLSCVLLLSACASYRGFPSHGGGKRFDEEQRIVAAVIQNTVNQIDISDLDREGGKKSKVWFTVASLETSGNATPNYPGLGKVTASAGYDFRKNEFALRQVPLPFPIQLRGLLAPLRPDNFGNAFANGNRDTDGELHQVTAGADISFQFNPSLDTANQSTRQDVDFLNQAVAIMLRSKGLQVVEFGQEDFALLILVDVLGTNLSRLDDLVLYKDRLEASCEITYYVLDPRNQAVLQASRSVGFQADYHESNIRFSPIRWDGYKQRKIDSTIITLAKLTGTPPGRGAAPLGRRSDDFAVLEDLYAKALEAIGGEDPKALKQVIKQIQNIAPNYDRLPELKLELESL